MLAAEDADMAGNAGRSGASAVEQGDAPAATGDFHSGITRIEAADTMPGHPWKGTP